MRLRTISKVMCSENATIFLTHQPMSRFLYHVFKDSLGPLCPVQEMGRLSHPSGLYKEISYKSESLLPVG